MEIADDNGLEIEYSYTDIFVICGLKRQVIDLNEPPTKKSIDAFFKKLIDGKSHEKIYIYRKMFLRAKTPDGLLALMGLNNNNLTIDWRCLIQKICCGQIKKLPAVEKTKGIINDELASIAEVRCSQCR